jgi:Tol biopolymer transport system component
VGKQIYFSSKGKDGITGKDIYVTSRTNGVFSTPVKVKGDVNTPYDEDYAYMHPNGHTLYFASKGHGSMGGYDIFRSEWDNATQQFGPAINMDFAINTPDDDVFFITDSLVAVSVLPTV